jgi:hypothetical protein
MGTLLATRRLLHDGRSMADGRCVITAYALALIEIIYLPDTVNGRLTAQRNERREVYQ